MNEIGERLQEVRESHGVSIEEAADDLNVKPSVLKSLEDGDIKKFKDVLYLKSFIRDYAKYLGMNSEKLVDDFNEYLFDYTSRIPIDKIREAQEKTVEEEKKIISPYTKPINNNLLLSKNILYILIILLIFIAGFLIVTGISNNVNSVNDENYLLSYYIRRWEGH